MIGLALVGWRYGGQRLAATLPFAWAAYPFTQYTSMSNTNDAILPAFLVFGLLRGAACAPRWVPRVRGVDEVRRADSWCPSGRRTRSGGLGTVLRFVAGLLVATVLSFSIFLLEPNLLDAARTFWDRTFGWQLGRQSPFSIWDWGQYHARGIPDLHVPHQVVKALVARGRGRRGLRPAPEVAAPARRADRRARRRVPARADALVLSLHPVVLPVRRLRALRSVTARRSRDASRRSPSPLALFVASWALLHFGFYDARPDRRHAGLRVVRRGDEGRRGSVPRLPRRVSAGRAACLRRAALADTDYRGAFEWLMALCGGGLVVAVALAARQLGLGFGTLAFVALSPLAIGSVILTRFDLWPAMLASFALAALLYDRLRLGHACSARRSRRSSTRRSSSRCRRLRVAEARAPRGDRLRARSSLGFVVAVYLPFFLVAPGGVLSSIGRQLRARSRSRASARRSCSRRTRRSASRSRCTRATARRTSPARRPTCSQCFSRSRRSPCSSGSGRGSRATQAVALRARGLRGGGADGVRRAREGALAAVPDLARPGRAARAPAPRDRAPARRRSC